MISSQQQPGVSQTLLFFDVSHLHQRGVSPPKRQSLHLKNLLRIIKVLSNDKRS